MIRNVFVFALLDELGHAALPRKNHISGVPGEFIVPKIVIALRSHKPSCKRLKKQHPGAAVLDPVNHLHGTHVIYAGIQTNFVHENQPFLLNLRIEFLQLFGDIRSRDQIFAELDTIFGNFHVEPCRKHGNDQIRPTHKILPGSFVMDVQRNHLSPCMSINQPGGIIGKFISYDQLQLLIIGLFQKVSHQSGSRSSRAHN